MAAQVGLGRKPLSETLMGYVLIGTEASQFSGKARAALRWKGVSFDEIVATPQVYRDLIEPRVGYGVIPVLLTEAGQAIQDSADIIDFADRDEAGPSIHPGTPLHELLSLLLELYADEWLVIAAMHYRWSHDDAWIVEEFGRTARPDVSREEQIEVGQVIAKPIRDAVPRFGVSDDTVSGIEAHFEGFLADFSAHLRKLPFVLGHRPSLGDFALFGALYGPFYLNPVLNEQMRRLAPLVVAWVERVRDARAGAGALLPNDEAPASLYPILTRQMSEQAPVLADAIRAMQEWAKAQPSGARVKRSLGAHEFVIGGRRGERSILTFALWRLQRVRDHYQSLTGGDRERAARLLDAVGGMALVSAPLPVRLDRRDYRLVVA
ncbi:MAG: glutathione S-transferase N-terminal domain-containing protein [Hyphomonadaceae bacterium]|nr:glutathione S-transferase N-terminal domain-containing protein [Hyphomonadaceae bacterium]